MLLARGMARLVVIDSVAAPFRCEFDGAALALRAQRLLALGAELRRLSCAFRSPVLCINQVGLLPAPRGARPAGSRDAQQGAATGQSPSLLLPNGLASTSQNSSEPSSSRI